MIGFKVAVLVIMVAVVIGVYGQNDDQNCPPEWSFVHQCWKSFELRYKQFSNNTEISVRQKEVEEMCSCMASAVNRVLTNAIIEITGEQ